MDTLLFNSTKYLFELLENVLHTNIHLHGLENVDKKRTLLFLPNHFTRFETMLLPYLISKNLDIKARSLASSALFTGVFGEYLNKVGTLSTKDEHRDEIIISDLICGKNPWVIYPEGSMVKNKKVVLEEGNFHLFLPEKELIHTGAAVIALTASLEKESLQKALVSGNVDRVTEIREKYFLDKKDLPSYAPIEIIPVNITYKQIRSQDNFLMKMQDILLDENDSEAVIQELQVDGTLLLNSQIHIRFLEPIDVRSFITENLSNNSSINDDKKSIIEHLRYPLINSVMHSVYKNTLITLDHIFSLILLEMDKELVTKKYLQALIYLTVQNISELSIYHLDAVLQKNLIALISSEKVSEFISILELALSMDIIEDMGHNHYKIDAVKLRDEHTFSSIRIKNTILVIANEILCLKPIVTIVQKNIHLKDSELYEQILFKLYNDDKKSFLDSYQHFYVKNVSKDKEVGEPFLLFNKKFSKAVVLVHGYKAAPKEMEALAHYLHKKGFNIYAVRLKGHGTTPEDLRDIGYEEWYESVNIGYAALKQVSKKLFVCGFSTGGLLALETAYKKHNSFDGLICINAAMKLQDIRAEYIAPAVHVFKDILHYFDKDVDVISNKTESPEINYPKHYVSSLIELEKLMSDVALHLKSVATPTLIIQGDNDPVVSPKGAQLIHNSISSKKKVLKIVKADKHVIINRSTIFKEIYNFLKELS